MQQSVRSQEIESVYAGTLDTADHVVSPRGVLAASLDNINWLHLSIFCACSTYHITACKDCCALKRLGIIATVAAHSLAHPLLETRRTETTGGLMGLFSKVNRLRHSRIPDVAEIHLH